MNLKFILFCLVVTVLLLGVGVFLLNHTGSADLRPPQILGQDSGVDAIPASYDLGNVPIKGGIVTKVYEVKNTTDKPLKLKKIATSCMCTTAKASVRNSETRAYGMEMTGDKNPSVNMEIPSGETATVTVQFDPAAHGPAGVGPIDRTVWLTFSDPVGVKELKFNGMVVSS